MSAAGLDRKGFRENNSLGFFLSVLALEFSATNLLIAMDSLSLEAMKWPAIVHVGFLK